MAAYYKVEVTLNSQAVSVGLPSPQSVSVTIPLIGPQGPVGATGSTGATGPANSLAIGAVSTGAAGSNASATITGTAPSQTLDLTIPRGDKGDTGDTGATGPANSLAIGAVSTGAAGSNADATITGTAPNQTLNLTIPVGATGATGPTGPQGPTIADANAPATNNILWQIRTTAFTAASGGRYVASGTFTVTNPASGNDGELFQVVVASGTVTVNSVAYGASRWPVTVARISGAWTTLPNTLTENLTLNGTNNTAPNQTAASGSSLITRDLGDARHPQKMTVTTTGVSNFYLADLLNSGTAGSPGIGGFEGGGLTFQAASSTERLAFWRGATGAVTNQKTRAVLRGTVTLNQGIFWSANFAGTLTMRFRLNQTTDCQLTVGLSSPAAAGAGSIIDKIGAYLRYDAATDTNFMFQNGATAANAVSSGVAVDTNWHVVRIRFVSTTSVFYSLDGGAETQVTVSTGSGSVSPAFFLMTTANTDKTADFSAVTVEATT